MACYCTTRRHQPGFWRQGTFVRRIPHPLGVRVTAWDWPGCMGSPVLTSRSAGGGRRQVWSQLQLRSRPTLFLQAARQHFMGRTAAVCASVRTEPAVTTSVASAPAAQASPGNTASRVSFPARSPGRQGLAPAPAPCEGSLPSLEPPTPGPHALPPEKGEGHAHNGV